MLKNSSHHDFVNRYLKAVRNVRTKLNTESQYPEITADNSILFFFFFLFFPKERSYSLSRIYICTYNITNTPYDSKFYTVSSRTRRNDPAIPRNTALIPVTHVIVLETTTASGGILGTSCFLILLFFFFLFLVPIYLVPPFIIQHTCSNPVFSSNSRTWIYS